MFSRINTEVLREAGESASGFLMALLGVCVLYLAGIGVYDFIQGVKSDRYEHRQEVLAERDRNLLQRMSAQPARRR